MLQPEQQDMKPSYIILAENFGPLYAIFFVICLSPVAAGVLGLLLTRRWPWIGLVCGWIGVTVGGLFFLLFLISNGGALPVFWIIASLPFAMGIACLVRYKTLRS